MGDQVSGHKEGLTMSLSHEMRMAIIKLDKKLGDHDAGQKYWVTMTLHMEIMTLEKKLGIQWA